MRLNKIRRIKGYKAFVRYDWKEFFDKRKFDPKVNVVFGENGSGKSSLVKILKNAANNGDFSEGKSKSKPEISPEVVCLDFEFSEKNGRLRYKNGRLRYKENIGWKRIPKEGIPEEDWILKDKIQIFDRYFIKKNVHQGGERDGGQGGQEQESGLLIVELHSEARALRQFREDVRKKLKLEDDHLKNFKDIKDFELNSDETRALKIALKIYKDMSPAKIDARRKAINDNIEKLTGDIESYQSRIRESAMIQASKDFTNFAFEYSLESRDQYDGVFKFDLKENWQAVSDEELRQRLDKYEKFFEQGFEMLEGDYSPCPFCGSIDREDQIRSIGKAFTSIYNETHREEIENFETFKEQRVKILSGIIETINSVNQKLEIFFRELSDLSQKLSSLEVGQKRDIYTLEEETECKERGEELQKEKLEELCKKISSLDRPTDENISQLFSNAKAEYEAAKDFFDSLAILRNDKISMIEGLSNPDAITRAGKFIEEILKILIKMKEAKILINYMDDDKVEEMKRREEYLKHKILQMEYKRELDEESKEYEEYCSSEAFDEVLKNMMKYFMSFDFDFELEATPIKQNTAEFQFGYNIYSKSDPEKNPRSLEEGLSEGEIQVLSLCFFFALLDVQEDTCEKIIVFDDPITSLDNANLERLVDLISKKKDSFSQIFIFTHHSTFFRFCEKKLLSKMKKNNNDNKKEPDFHSEFNLIRNYKELGGSFLCASKSNSGISFEDELRNFVKKIKITATRAPIDIELEVVRHGQYLRYEVEQHIKNKVLHWNKEGFASIIAGIKSSQNISDDSLDKILGVYNFCNYTTEHVTTLPIPGRRELVKNIQIFFEAKKKVKSRNKPRS